MFWGSLQEDIKTDGRPKELAAKVAATNGNVEGLRFPDEVTLWVKFGGDREAFAVWLSSELREVCPVPEASSAFPLSALPSDLRACVEEMARSMRQPLDYFIGSSVAAIAAAIGNRYELRYRETWRERAPLWVVLVGASGEGKSPAMKAAIAELQRLHGKKRAEYIDRKRAYEQAKEEKSADEKPQRPRPVERVVLSDTTLEAVYRALSCSPQGLIQVVDEFVGFLDGLNKYRKGGGDMDAYLSMWDLSPCERRASRQRPE